MKKLLLTLLASLLFTGSAWAEWVKVGENDSADYYIDPATIRKDGNLRRVWDMFNLKERDKDGTSSIRARVEYDCKQERERTLSISNHSEPMAKGITLIDGMNDALRWKDIPPNSLAEKMLKIVCAK